MSLIHKFIEDIEIGEPVKCLFKQLVTEFEKQNSNDWDKQVKQTTNDYHRKTILKQGRCDFDNPPLNLTSEELIVLYNYYYFPMHFQSSLDIYNKLFEGRKEFQNQKFFFHDYGCGTLSSTLAFSTCFSKHYKTSSFKCFNQLDSINKFNAYYCENEEISFFLNSEYLFEHQIESSKVPNTINGYWLNDISKEILKFIIHFIKIDTELHYSGGGHFFNRAITQQGRYTIPIIADTFYIGEFTGRYNDSSHIEPFKSFCNSQNFLTSELTVILNFSYVLASESIKIEAIKLLIDDYLNTGCNLIIANQNPDLDSLNLKWGELKRSIHYTESVAEIQSIKHFGKKSKSRYEVLFCIRLDSYNGFKMLQKNYDFTRLQTEGDYLSLIDKAEELDIFNLNKIQNRKDIDNLTLLKIPLLNAATMTAFSDYFIEFDENWYTILDDVILNILNRSTFIEFLILLISENAIDNQKYLFTHFDSTETIDVFFYCEKAILSLPNVLISLWLSIFNNIDLLKIYIESNRINYFIKQENTFGITFRRYLINHSNIIYLKNLQLATLYELSYDFEKAKVYLEKDVVIGYNSFYYTVFMKKYYSGTNFQSFINNHKQHDFGVEDDLPF